MSDRNLRIRMLLEGADRLSRPMRDAAQGSSRLARNLAATRERLKDLQRAQASLGEFRELKGGLRESAARMAAAQARATQLGRAMGNTANPTRAMTREFEKARREAERIAGQHRQNVQRLQEMRTRLAAAGVSTRDLAGEERRLRGEIERTNGGLRDQERRLQQVTERARRFADARERFSRVQGIATGLAVGGAAAVGTGMAITRPLEGSADDAMQFESSMTDINQKIGQARDAGHAFGKKLRQMAIDTNQFVPDLQRGADALAGAGIGLQDIERMLPKMGRAATAYKADMEELAKTNAAVHDNLGVSANDIGAAQGIMAQAGKAGNFEVKDMAQYFPGLTASMQSFGSKGLAAVADLASALQIVRKGAGDSSTAATNLMNLLAKMNAEDTTKSFAKFGIDMPKALKKAVAEGRSPLEEFVRLTQKVTGGDQAKLSGLFGDMQVQQALRPLMSNMKLYEDIRREASAAGEKVVDADFVERMADSAEQLRHLKIETGDLSITLGNQLLPAIVAGAKYFSGWATRIKAVTERHPVLVKGLALAAATIGVLMIAVGGLGIMLAGVVAPFAALGAAALFLEIGMLPLLGIIAAIVVGIGLLVAAGYYLVENWGNWPKIMQDVVGALKWVFMNFSPIGLLIRAFAPALDYLRSINLSEIGRQLLQGLINGIKMMFPVLTATMGLVGNMLPDKLRKVLGIHSPSRVFAELGGHVIGGLDQGLARNAPAPIARINSLADQMTRALAVGAGGAAAMAFATPVAASPAAASTPAAVHRSYSITIKVDAGAGQMGQNIKAAVREAIEEIEREHRGRTFEDLD